MPAVVPFIPLMAAGVGAGATVYGSKSQSSAAQRAAQAQQQTANYAADLEAKSAADQLAFAKEQEAQRHAEFDKTQTLNRSIYDEDVAREQGRYDQRQGRLAPYINWGYGSIGQLMRPMPGTGSLGSRMGG